MGAHLSKAAPAINTLQVVQSRIQFPSGPTAAPARIMVTTDRHQECRKMHMAATFNPFGHQLQTELCFKIIALPGVCPGYLLIYLPSLQTGSGRHLSSKHCYFSGPMFLWGLVSMYFLREERQNTFWGSATTMSPSTFGDLEGSQKY